jgi:hypothetical protein
MVAGVFIAGLVMLVAATVGHRISIRQIVIPHFHWSVRAAFGALGVAVMALAVLPSAFTGEAQKPPADVEIAEVGPAGPKAPLDQAQAPAPVAQEGARKTAPTGGATPAGGQSTAGSPTSAEAEAQPFASSSAGSDESNAKIDLRDSEFQKSIIAAASRCVGTATAGDNQQGGQVGVCITNNNGPNQAGESEE